MMTRNMVWLAVIVAVGLIGWLAFGLVVGLIAAATTLVVSEVFERWARARRRAAQTSP
jgi:ABC-type transport system involved in cytochrome bd biosynthesis fused ATPase/permease subunit